MREYIDQLNTSFKSTGALLEGVELQDWSATLPGGWSIGHEAQHLLSSIEPILLALALPKQSLATFGKPNRSPRSYEELCARYNEKLLGLKETPRSFDPLRKGAPAQRKFLRSWNSKSQKLISLWSRWKEKDLDRYLVPHPLLGKIHMRELIYFTLYHNQLHSKSIRSKIEWLNYQAEPIRAQEQIERLSKVAHSIWNEHYPSIIGQEQANHMLAKFQSVNHIKKQIKEEQFHYFLLTHNGEAVGYWAYQEEKDSLFISKIYLYKSHHSKGLGKYMLNHIVDEAKRLNKMSVWLTVNKYNDAAIRAYERWHFVREEELVIDIGKGYIMDDYKYRKTL